MLRPKTTCYWYIFEKKKTLLNLENLLSGVWLGVNMLLLCILFLGKNFKNESYISKGHLLMFDKILIYFDKVVKIKEKYFSKMPLLRCSILLCNLVSKMWYFCKVWSQQEDNSWISHQKTVLYTTVLKLGGLLFTFW